MKRISLILIAVAAAAVLLWAQGTVSTAPARDRYEFHAVLPLETSPGVYAQVEQSELQLLADQGWELVSVAPFVVRNEERGPDTVTPRPVVTQFYPAYYFKRLRQTDRR